MVMMNAIYLNSGRFGICSWMAIISSWRSNL